MPKRPNFDPASLLYTRETVLTAKQVAAGLQVGESTVEKLNIPCFFLGKRTKRYIWGAVLDFCEKRQF